MTSIEIEKYENLQEEYKKLFAEYEEIKKNNPQSPLLAKKVEELDEKQKALKIALGKLTN
jgi:hypothetical protein